ncbi:MAG TPA: cytochrome c oxidase subunit II [Bacteroidales bacterium]|nr:cytochrome c oxidase subunit II [Bacteroidales bacterium]
MFSEASNFTAGVDKTFAFIIGISLFFLIGLTVTMIVFAVKYRRNKHPKAVQVKENMTLEVTWIIIPLVLVLAMFYFGYQAYMPMRNAPKDAHIIKVYGKMWQWDFDYGNGKMSKDTLMLPLGKPVKLELNAVDVGHSFFIPAFRIKEDLVPKKTNYMWFIPQQEGNYEAFCTVFCGLRHSYMEAIVKVVPEKDYEQWLANLKAFDPNSVPEGLTILKQNACTGCHSIDGSSLVGPSFKGLFESERVVMTNSAERKIKADSAYLHQSIVAPDDDVVKGFNKGIMRSYKQTLSDKDISKIIEYMKLIEK